MSASPSPSPVPRIGRLLDVAGVLLILAGAACCGWAYLGLEQLRASGGKAFTPNMLAYASLTEYRHWMHITWFGLALIAGGIGVAVWAAVVARRMQELASVTLGREYGADL